MNVVCSAVPFATLLPAVCSDGDASTAITLDTPDASLLLGSARVAAALVVLATTTTNVSQRRHALAALRVSALLAVDEASNMSDSDDDDLERSEGLPAAAVASVLAARALGFVVSARCVVIACVTLEDTERSAHTAC
jgi:hypothetical protein